MEVTIMNPEVLQNLYKNHGEFACVCYGTDESHAEKVGLSCEKTGHMSGSRCEYIKFRITNVDRGTAEQLMRHEIGTHIPFEFQNNYSFADYAELVKTVSEDEIVKNMASFRYIDKTGFEWEPPYVINKHPGVARKYHSLMEHINKERSELLTILTDDYHEDLHAAVEAVNFVLPRATLSELVVGFTPEAFIHFCHERLCTRAQEFFRTLARLTIDMVKRVNVRLVSIDEITNNTL